MEKPTKFMLKKVTNYSFIFMITLIILQGFFKSTYLEAFLCGFLIAIVNFYINSFSTEIIIKGKDNNEKIFTFIITMIRVLLGGSVGILISGNSRSLLIPYILGYSLFSVVLIFYAITLKE